MQERSAMFTQQAPLPVAPRHEGVTHAPGVAFSNNASKPESGLVNVSARHITMAVTPEKVSDAQRLLTNHFIIADTRELLLHMPPDQLGPQTLELYTKAVREQKDLISRFKTPTS